MLVVVVNSTRSKSCCSFCRISGIVLVFAVFSSGSQWYSSSSSSSSRSSSSRSSRNRRRSSRSRSRSRVVVVVVVVVQQQRTDEQKLLPGFEDQGMVHG